MGNVVVYTGQAGTGKTTSLMNLLREIIPQREWQKFETVLALTFMHGSRKRLESNLKFVKTEFKVRYECSTIDSFALSILNRFRSFLNIYKPIRPEEKVCENPFEYFMTLDIIRDNLIHLLDLNPVKIFISNSYPFIMIDEFQDCTGSLLEIIKRLANSTNLLIASDQFQQLSEPENLEGVKWISENNFVCHDLNSSGIKRTTNKEILLTATCLRTGTLISGSKIDILPCPGGKKGSFPFAEYQLKANIHYNIKYGNIAIISPTKNSTFISELLNSLSKPYTYKKPPFKTIGPYNHLLGSDGFLNLEELIKDLPSNTTTREGLKELQKKKLFVLNKCAERLLKRLSLRNQEEISYNEFYYVLQQTVHTYNNFYRRDNRASIVFTTIHGAKNREFDNVIVLWPYKVSSDLLQKRKLLYNAITRAKKKAIVIVQHKSAELQDLANDDLFSLIIDKKN